MNWIEKMIVEQCPKGVGASLLGSCSSIIRGNRVTKGQIKEIGRFPVISGGVTPMGFLDEYNRDENTITISQYGTAGYVDFQLTKFWANDICYSVYPDEVLDNRFLYYYLKNKQEFLYSIRNTNATPYSMPIETLKNVSIPLPPLSIQEEIVSVLDKFSELIEKTDEEIALRQKQYEYYREKLLTFEDGEVEWKKISDLFEFKNGLNKEKSAFGHGTPIINYTDVYHKRGLRKDDIKGLVELSKNEISRYKCQKGDVFFTRTSETKEEVGFPSVLLEDLDNCTFSGFVLRAHPLTKLLLPEYCKYCFFNYYFRCQVIKSATLTTRALTNGKSLGKITIPVPHLSRQQSIVATLDKFEALISKLKEERELRQKQYEYYREKLLTF